MLKNVWKHFNLVCHHKWEVFKLCCHAGIPVQGLLHDMSKFTPSEFFESVKYYNGHRSPLAVSREINGYSKAWLHHKGRNKHHWEYWTDLNLELGQYAPVPMPRRYLAEMVMDRIAACKVYQGDKYTDASALIYLEKGVDRIRMHPQTQRELEYILTMLRDEGEEKTFRYIKNEVLQGKPFPWEQEA